MDRRKNTLPATGRPLMTLVLVLTLALIVLGAQPGQAQTFTPIFSFSGGNSGAVPVALTPDRAGNLYGVTLLGGASSVGTVFKLSKRNSSWVLTTLYQFLGGTDGSMPSAPLSIGPDGALYGTTNNGGSAADCGVVFKLTPPATVPVSVQAPWTETVLHVFTGGANDGCNPSAALTWDQQGNMYSTTQAGGAYGQGGDFNGYGTVFELSRSGSGWTEQVVYNFSGGTAGLDPMYAGVAFDRSGNLVGATSYGGSIGCHFGCGVIYRLTPSGSGWSETVLYTFGVSEGTYPNGGVIMDSAGNLYGATETGGPQGGGTVFELTGSGNNWTLQVLASLSTGGGQPDGPQTAITLDAAGNLYGTTYGEGLYQEGMLFSVTHSGNNWNYATLHDFTGGDDGYIPLASVVFGPDGTLYGAAALGGVNGGGVIYQVTF